MKSIKDLSRREQKAQRQKWTEANKRRKDKQLLENMTDRYIDFNSPPQSPCPDDLPPLRVEPQPSTSRQKSSGEKRRRKNNAKMKKELEKLKKQYTKEKMSKNKYKRRYYRLLHKKGNISASPSPRKIVNTVLKDKTEVRKRLVFLEVIKKQMNTNKKTLTENEKNIVAKALSGDIMESYRKINEAKDLVSPYLQKKINRLMKADGRSAIINRKIRLGTYNKYIKLVTEFYEDDENSTQSPEKSAVISKKGVTKVKRYLNDSMFNLHKKFTDLFQIKLSYTTFRRMKPFHVRVKRLKERDTCSCIKHVNFNFKIQKLHMLGLLQSRNMRDLMKKLCCDVSSQSCMYRSCEECKDRDILYKPENFEDFRTRTFYYQWSLCNHVYFNNKNEEVTTKITAKQKNYCTVRELIETLKKKLFPSYLLMNIGLFIK